MQITWIGAIARGQLGLVTRAQLGARLKRHHIDHAVAIGVLEVVRTGVYRVAGAPESWEQHVLAACLAGGPTARASFRTAAALWGLEGFACDGLEITVAPSRRARLPEVVVHQSSVSGPLHQATRFGIPVASVARTLCDLTAVLRPWMVERAVDEALRRKLVTVHKLARVAADLEGRGRHRCTVMREILERRLPGYHPGESEPEKRIAELLVRAGLPEPTRQHRVSIGAKRYRVDLCYPEAKLAIEYDSWGFHRGRQAFDDDRARGNDLVVLGFQVLRFTSKSSDDQIVDTVRTALHRTSVG